jgi:hypothetical protein
MRIGSAIRAFSDRPLTLVGLVLLAFGMRTVFEYAFTASLEEDTRARSASVRVEHQLDDPPPASALPMIRMNDRAPVAASIDPLFVAGGVGGLVMCLGVVGALYVARRSSAEEEAEPR